MSGLDFLSFGEKANRDYREACEELKNDSSLPSWAREALLEELRKEHSKAANAAIMNLLFASEGHRKTAESMFGASASTKRKKRPGNLDPDLFDTDPWVDDPDAYLLDDDDDEDD